MDPLQLTQASGTVEPETRTPVATSKRPDVLQLAFWVMIGVAVATAIVAIGWPEAGGMTAPITLIALAMFFMVSLLWILRGAGRRLGLFPQRGAAAEAIQTNAPRFAWIDALDEAVLVSERGGAPIAANSAYRALVEQAVGAPQDQGRPMSPDRALGGYNGLAAPIYRMSKAVKGGAARRETLPAITFGPDALPAQFEAHAAPLAGGRALWRFRRITGSETSTGAADMRGLYVEDAPLGFFAARPDGTLTYANAWLRDLIGLAENHAPVRIDDIMRPEFVKLLRRDKKKNGTSRADITIRGRDGVDTPVQAITTWSGRGIEANGRTLILPQRSGLDETSSGGAQVASSDPMFKDAPFGVVRLEGEAVDQAVILDANPALMDMTGGRSAPGEAFADIFSAPDGRDTLQAKVADAVDRPVALVLAGDVTRNVNVFVTLDKLGRPQAAYVIDITEQKELETRLAHGEKMQAIGQLAGGVAHDFNNLLTAIMLRTDALLTRHPVGDPSYPELKEIHEQAVRAAEFVRSLVAYSRKQTFRQEVLDATNVIADLRRILEQLLDERVRLDVVHGRDLPRVRADERQLQTCILNLATNARDAMLANGRGGSLTIKTSRSNAEEAHALGYGYVEGGDYLLIEVIDTGHGMPHDVMEKIFEPFFTTKDQGQGTGLGLATVYGIIKQSGGYICVSSKVGKGSTFRIYLPALSADEVPEPVEHEADATEAGPADLAGRGRILLVEDEDGVRGITAQLLTARGYDVEQAPDGEEALEIIQEADTPFDLVISDVVMPGMDGPAMIKEARPYLKSTRIIFISGYAERDLAKTLDEEQEISFLPKPFTVVQLAERVKQELAKKKEAA